MTHPYFLLPSSVQKPTKFDRVVRREVCQLSSAGTRVWGVQDTEPGAGGEPAYLLAVTSKVGSGCCINNKIHDIPNYGGRK